MSVPTISSVTPAIGHPGGGTVVRIDGTGFQLPPEPDGSVVPVPEAAATVRVFFGGVEARLVRVASSTRLYVTTERGDPATVAVEVRNVGPFGETIGSEVATAAAAWEYRRPALTGRGTLTRAVRRLVEELVRQVHPEVVLTEHVDWTDDPMSALRKVSDAKLPCVWLSGPALRDNKLYRTNVRPLVQLGDVQLEHRAPRTVDLVFGCGAMADTEGVLLELTAALVDFAHRNPWLYMATVEGGAELVRYELALEADPEVDSSPSESNVKSSAGTITVVGVDLLGLEGFDNDEALTAHPEADEIDVGSVPRP